MMMLANLVLAYGFLRAKQVPEGCCHTCEWCCMTECHEKYAATITSESLVQKSSAPDALMACLDKKVPKKGGKCAKNTWSPKRVMATKACAKAALFSLIQEDPVPGDEDFDPALPRATRPLRNGDQLRPCLCRGHRRG